MSVQASSWVIEYSRHKGSALLVLLMIANHAHADGSNAFPSVDTLARECRMSTRQITRIIAALEESGELLVERSAGRLSHRYRLPYVVGNLDKMTGLDTNNPDKLSTLTLTNPTPNPDISDTNPDKSDANPDIAVSPEPITVKEPSTRKDVGSRASARSPADDSRKIEALRQNPAYKHIDFDREFGKMRAWCEANGKQATVRRLVNWLNRVEAPLNVAPISRPAHAARPRAAPPGPCHVCSDTGVEHVYNFASQKDDKPMPCSECGGRKAKAS